MQGKMTLEKEIVERIKFVARYVGSESNDWFRIKKELINTLKPHHRRLFSKRHKTSKKFFVNDHEKEIMTLWKVLTNTTLVIDSQKLHQPSDERPPRHWALMQLNNKRKEEKQKRLEKKGNVDKEESGK